MRVVLLPFALVVAVLAGLLAMHTLATTMGSHSAASASVTTMSAGEHHHVSDSPPTIPGAQMASCSGTCDPGHTMAAMACILALLVAALLVAGTRAVNATLPFAAPAQLRALFDAARARAAAPPPDLIVLSISRT